MQKYIMICLIILICLPVFAEIKDPDIEYCSYATTADGAVVGYYGEKARVEVSQINQISRYVINA
ncbi:MAG: hypothetical protein KA886_06815, partial [Candidatus Cloacimonetes bacterium]|nr:hypothetical protein [Candidatus Cloacimonadota bacterium]